ncbi:MAG: thiamine-phosphate kinase [Deltaproteobacteria bacterium]|nr:thiamine-phosphate kinase [Deltaproteobacteria bacterium]
MTETELIEKLTRNIPRKKGPLQIGIGDDCSVIRAGNKDILISCDSLVQNIHFKKSWGSWNIWGAKAAAAALSDIAAMGGKPCYAWINLALPAHFKTTDIQKFYKGLLGVFKKFDVTLAGGNITRAPEDFAATTTVWGEVKKGKAMLRSQAKPGDAVYVGGALGKRGQWQPQIKLGEWLVSKGCKAAIDVSDGLLKDLEHMAQASLVKIVIEADKVPHVGKLKEALTYGEDYILAFTMATSVGQARGQGPKIFKIGKVVKGKPGVQVVNSKGQLLSFQKKGFEHKVG